MGYTLGVPGSASVGIILTVALGSLALSFIGSIGAALTLGARRGDAVACHLDPAAQRHRF